MLCCWPTVQQQNNVIGFLLLSILIVKCTPKQYNTLKKR